MLVACATVCGQEHDPSRVQAERIEYRIRAARAEIEWNEAIEAAAAVADVATTFAKKYPAGLADSGGRRELDRVRKLARKIRSTAGGSGAPTIAPLPDPATATRLLVEKSTALLHEIKDSSRFEMNARVVALSGDVQFLAELLRKAAD
jgi:hypothetical protein